MWVFSYKLLFCDCLQRLTVLIYRISSRASPNSVLLSIQLDRVLVELFYVGFPTLTKEPFNATQMLRLSAIDKRAR